MTIHLRHLRASTLAGQVQSFAKDRIALGRDPGGDVVFDAYRDRIVSTRHAELFVWTDNLYVQDNQSANGTFVNGNRITTATAIGPNDVVHLGEQGPQLSASFVASARPGVGGAGQMGHQAAGVPETEIYPGAHSHAAGGSAGAPTHPAQAPTRPTDVSGLPTEVAPAPGAAARGPSGTGVTNPGGSYHGGGAPAAPATPAYAGSQAGGGYGAPAPFHGGYAGEYEVPEPGSGLAICAVVFHFAGLVQMAVLVILALAASSSGSGGGATAFMILFMTGPPTSLIGSILYLVWLHSAWKAVPPPYRSTTPGAAVGFLFIPVFSAYWIFRAVLGLSKSIQRAAQAAGIEYEVRGAGFGMGLTALISMFVCAGFGLAPIFFLIWILSANSAKNKLLREYEVNPPRL